MNSAVGAAPTFNAPTFSGTGVGAFAVAKSQVNAAGGSACIWRAVTTGTPTAGTISVSVTTTGGGSVSPDAAAWCDVWTGCDPVQTGAATAGSTSTTQNFSPTVTTTRAGSRVVGVGIDWAARGVPTSTDTIDGYTVAGQTSGGRAFKAADSGAPGSVALNFNAAAASPQWTVALIEIFAAPGRSWRSINLDGPGKHPGPRRFEPLARGISQPAVNNNLSVSIDTPGQITLTGQSFTTSISVPISAGQITLAGQAFSSSISVPISNGQVTLAGQAFSSSISTPISAGQITLAGQSFTSSIDVPISAGAITLAGQSVTSAIGLNVQIDAGQVTLAGQAFTVSINVPIDAGSVVLAGQDVTSAVAAGGDISVTIDAGQIMLAGQDFTVQIADGQIPMGPLGPYVPMAGTTRYIKPKPTKQAKKKPKRPEPGPPTVPEPPAPSPPPLDPAIQADLAALKAEIEASMTAKNAADMEAVEALFLYLMQ